MNFVRQNECVKINTVFGVNHELSLKQSDRVVSKLKKFMISHEPCIREEVTQSTAYSVELLIYIFSYSPHFWAFSWNRKGQASNRKHELSSEDIRTILQNHVKQISWVLTLPTSCLEIIFPKKFLYQWEGATWRCLMVTIHKVFLTAWRLQKHLIFQSNSKPKYNHAF